MKLREIKIHNYRAVIDLCIEAHDYPMPDGLAAHLPPPAFKIKTADDEQNSEIVVTVKLIPLWARDMSTPSMQDPRLTEAEFAAA